MFTQIFCLVIGLFLVNTSVSASTIKDLNKAVVPLFSQDLRSQKNAYRNALNQVLIKLTGDKAFMEHPKHAKLLTDAMQFVTSTEFIEGKANQLLVIFNQDLLERWIKRNGLPLWGAQRPEGLLWFIEQSYSSKARLMLTDSSTSDTAQILNKQLFNRGISLDLPLMDITDVKLVSEIDVWGQFIDILHEAAIRYDTPYTIGARLVETSPDNWVLDYFVKSESALRLKQLTGNNKENLIRDFVSDYAEFQAQKYALDTARFVENTQFEQKIVVSGVTDIIVLSEIEAYLSSLSIVEKVQLINQNSFNSSFTVKLLDSPEKFHRILLNGNKMAAVKNLDNTPADDTATIFSYDWR